MVFVGGALAGCVVGFGVATLLQRRSGRPNFAEGRGLATAIALIALLVAAIALARSDRERGEGRSAAPATPTSTVPTPARSGSASTTTTRPARSSRLVTVPNVEHLARADAVDILERAGLEVTIESLGLSNVPVGFVISQNPLPGAMTTTGATVTLVVSAAA